MTFPWVGGALHFSPIGEEPLRQDPDFDRDFWRAHARRSMREDYFDALESGRLHFGDWERLFLSAATDHFRDRHFEQASMSAHASFMSNKDRHLPASLLNKRASRIIAPNTKNSLERSQADRVCFA
jgi:hypothetical protein